MKKKGTPTRAVITPIGRMAPGINILLTTDVADKCDADHDARQKEPLVLPYHHARDMRPDQPDVLRLDHVRLSRIAGAYVQFIDCTVRA